MMNYVNLTEVMEQLSRHLLKIEVVFFFFRKIFVAPGEHDGFSFFQVKRFTGSVSVLFTSASLKKLNN